MATLNFGLLMGKRGRIHGSMLRVRTREEKADVIRRLARRRAAAARGRTHPACRSRRRSRWTEAQDAYERFAAGGKFGKIVIVP